MYICVMYTDHKWSRMIKLAWAALAKFKYVLKSIYAQHLKISYCSCSLHHYVETWPMTLRSMTKFWVAQGIRCRILSQSSNGNKSCTSSDQQIRNRAKIYYLETENEMHLPKKKKKKEEGWTDNTVEPYVTVIKVDKFVLPVAECCYFF